MAITLRSTKGSPLTHTELDTNFREFFYSASIDGSSIVLHKYTAISSSLSFPVNPPKGRDQYIQIKAGNAESGSQALFTGSANFKFDYNSSHLKVTGSFTNVGAVAVTGNQSITGNLVVGGSVTAEEFISEKVATTYLYKSGSTKFGDTADDIHSFTGSLKVQGNVVSSGNLTVAGAINATEINTTYISSSVLYNTGSNIFGDQSTDLHRFTGSVQITNVLSIPGYSNVSSSLASLETTATPVTLAGSLDYITLSGQQITRNAIDIDTDLSVTPTQIGKAILTGSNAAAVRATIGVDVAGTDNSTNVSLVTTSHDYLSIVGQAITLGQIDISDDTNLATGTGVTLTGDTLSIGQAVGTTDSVTFGKVTAAAGSTNGFTFPADPGGGSGDAAKIVYYASTGENTVLEIAVANDADDNIYLNASGGTDVENDLRVTGDVTAFYSSDERLKDNITPISNAIDKIKQIGGYEFDWNENSKQEGHDVGVIAQEVEKILPELVTTRDNGYKAVRYEKIVALLIEAIKDQQSQIEDLKSKL